MLKEIPLTSLEKSDLNERRTDDPEDGETFQTLVDNIAAVERVNDPPLVRPLDGGGYEIITGSRRVRAARHVDGLDAVECQVEQLDDREALLRSITDNITAFREDVPARDRALSKFWAEKGDTRNPSPTGLAKMLGVSTSTVADWLEPLSEEWEDTFINPLSDSQQVSEVRTGVYDLTISQLQAIRDATGGGEPGEHLANKTVERGLTAQEIRDAGDHIEDGLAVADAAAVVDADETTVESLQADTAATEDEATSPPSDAEAEAPDAPGGAEPTDAETNGGSAAGVGTGEHADASTGESEESTSASPSASSSRSGSGSGGRGRGGGGRRRRQQATAHEGAQNDSESTDEILAAHAGRTSSGSDPVRDVDSDAADDGGNQQEQEDWETYTGKISVANERARAQLQERGKLVMFRTGPVPTGPCHWAPVRDGEREGTVLVGKCEDVDPQADAELGPYRPWSGFDSLQEWREAIGDLPGSGSLYVLTETAIEEYSEEDDQEGSA